MGVSGGGDGKEVAKIFVNIFFYSLYIDVCIIYIVNFLRKISLNKNLNTIFINIFIYSLLSFFSFLLLYFFTYDKSVMDSHYQTKPENKNVYMHIFLINILIFLLYTLVALFSKRKLANLLIILFFLLGFTFILWSLSATNPTSGTNARVVNIQYFHKKVISILTISIFIGTMINLIKFYFVISKEKFYLLIDSTLLN